MPDAKTGVLCMAYGSPAGTDEDDGIEAYYTHIRGGRKPSLEALAELRERYRAIGGSPLTEITRAQALQVFDSWVGALSPADYEMRVLPYTRRIFEATASLHVPRIHFGTRPGMES